MGIVGVRVIGVLVLGKKLCGVFFGAEAEEGNGSCCDDGGIAGV